MLVDFDDFSQFEHRLDLLERLHDANPAFRCTLFAIPAQGTDEFWNSVPEWCELAMHGWAHPHSRECEDWTYERTVAAFLSRPGRFVRGFKAPGWQISDATYEVTAAMGWWVADHWENDWRRPDDLRVHVISREAGAGVDPEHWHGHIPDVCGNGIAETFDTLLARVRNAESFEVMSEVVR